MTHTYKSFTMVLTGVRNHLLCFLHEDNVLSICLGKFLPFNQLLLQPMDQSGYSSGGVGNRAHLMGDILRHSGFSWVASIASERFYIAFDIATCPKNFIVLTSIFILQCQLRDPCTIKRVKFVYDTLHGTSFEFYYRNIHMFLFVLFFIQRPGQSMPSTSCYDPVGRAFSSCSMKDPANPDFSFMERSQFQIHALFWPIVSYSWVGIKVQVPSCRSLASGLMSQTTALKSCTTLL